MNPIICEMLKWLITDHKLNTYSFVKIYRRRSGFSLVFFYNCLTFSPLSSLLGSHDKTDEWRPIVTMTTYTGNTNTDQNIQKLINLIYSLCALNYISALLLLSLSFYLCWWTYHVPIVSYGQQSVCHVGNVIYKHLLKEVFNWLSLFFVTLPAFSFTFDVLSHNIHAQ